MPETKTRRLVTAGGLEVRASSTGVTVEGHASTFNQAYDMGWYSESVAPGAFSRTLGRSPDVRLLVNHDGLPLARTTSGTLELSQDDSGLYMRSTLDAADPDVKRLVPKMARGDLNQMSFAFGLVDGGDEWDADYKNRTLRHLNLDGGDVSIVTYPANPNATVSMRSRMLETPDKLRALYREIMANGKPAAGLAVEMRSLLENIALEDQAVEGSLTALHELVNTPQLEARSDGDDEALKSAAAAAAAAVKLETKLRKMRIAVDLLK